MSRWKRATIISVVVTLVVLIVVISLTISTACDSIVIKQAVRTAVGASPPRPEPSGLGLPPQPPHGHVMDRAFTRFAADLVARLHASEESTPPPVLNSVETFNSSSGKQNGWMLHGGDQVWLVFRGTSTRDEWNRDFELQQTPFLSRLVTKNLRKMTYPKLSQSPQDTDTVLPVDALVHSGFLAIYLDIRDMIMDAISRHKHQHVCVTGHSLGGALAQFATYDIATTHPDKLVDTVVFGCPRVGDPVFADQLAQPVNVNSFVALANTCDMVPNLPLAVQPVAKSDSPLIYQHPPGTHNFTDNRGTWTANHMMAVYIDYVESLK